MIYQETATEISASIFQILSRTLKHEGYKALEPEARRSTLEEAGRLLKSSTVPLTNKRQIVNYLSAIKSQEWVSEAEKEVISAIENNWNSAPL